MQQRNVLSRFFSFKRIALGFMSCFAVTAQAQNFTPSSEQTAPAQAPSFLALFSAPTNTQPTAPAAALNEPLAIEEIKPGPALPGTIDLTTPTDDLWDRVRNGFAMPNLYNDAVMAQQQYYQSRPEALRRMVDRSKRYLHYIVAELEKRGMPTELALLPMVESAFNPMAYSRAHASGLWQFIPATGKTYNLEQNWWYDQRRDIVASTNAALDYLQTIYEMHGDWHLALASYNWGENAVKRAIEKNVARGLPTDFNSLNMPAETRNYVPKLQALKNIFANPKLVASLNLPKVPNQPYFATVDTNRDIDVKKAAQLANMPLEEFMALNPAHNRPVIKADVPVVLPADKVSTFQSNLEAHDQPLSSWQSYTLKPGEKLDKVAPRFGLTLADLKRINGLNGKISAGTTLLVPSGFGADTEGVAPQEPRLPAIAAAPEPKAKADKVADRKDKSGKLAKAGKAEKNGGKLAKADKSDRSEAKSGKLAKADKAEGKASKSAKADRSEAKATKVAKSDAKPAKASAPSSAKVAKNGNGRRT